MRSAGGFPRGWRPARPRSPRRGTAGRKPRRLSIAPSAARDLGRGGLECPVRAHGLPLRDNRGCPAALLLIILRLPPRRAALTPRSLPQREHPDDATLRHVRQDPDVELGK